MSILFDCTKLLCKKYLWKTKGDGQNIMLTPVTLALVVSFPLSVGRTIEIISIVITEPLTSRVFLPAINQRVNRRDQDHENKWIRIIKPTNYITDSNHLQSKHKFISHRKIACKLYSMEKFENGKKKKKLNGREQFSKIASSSA